MSEYIELHDHTPAIIKLAITELVLSDEFTKSAGYNSNDDELIGEYIKNELIKAGFLCENEGGAVVQKDKEENIKIVMVDLKIRNKMKKITLGYFTGTRGKSYLKDIKVEDIIMN